MKRSRRPRPPVSMPSGFVGFRFPPEVILLAVRWYLRYGLSYRDLEELLAERGIEVDHVTLYRWVQRFTPLLIEAARPCRHVVGDRWFVDETYVKVSGAWRYVYRAVDQHGQVIDVYVSQRRDIASARTFFTAALTVHGDPTEVITDRAPALANVIEELVPAALHNTGQYENNRVECDHGRLKARLRPMRELKTHRTASVVIRGHAFIQNLRRGHYELADARPAVRAGHRLRRTPTGHLTTTAPGPASAWPAIHQRNRARPDGPCSAEPTCVIPPMRREALVD
jgi:transposase, IS6 family